MGRKLLMGGLTGLVLACGTLVTANPQLPSLHQAENGSVRKVFKRLYNKVYERLEPRFRYAGVDWPPKRVSLVALKEQRLLEVWVEQGDQWVHVHDYLIRAASGKAGPKLREGDRQVPEGFYNIIWLNPHSQFHLSMKLDYPNNYDRSQARKEGRTGLGGDIFIHGEEASRGCLAMGNSAIEDLFVLTALVGKDNVSVLIAPRDLRAEPLPGLASLVPRDWVEELTRDIAAALQAFPLERK